MLKLPCLPVNIDPKNLYYCDFETKLIGLNTLAPEPICFSISNPEQGDYLISNGDTEFKQFLSGFIQSAIDDRDMIIVCQNAKFDLHVLGNYIPSTYDQIVELYDRGQIVCTVLVDKLINLTTTGSIDREGGSDDNDSGGRKIEYNLASLLKKYTGEDISASKEAEDAVRTRYQELDGIPTSRYPAEFFRYSVDDSKHLRTIFEYQLQLRSHIIETKGFDPLATLSHRCSLDYHLYRFSMEGVRTNKAQIEFLEQMLDTEITPSKLDLLYPEFNLEPDKFLDEDNLLNLYVYMNYDYERSVIKPEIPERLSYRWSHVKGCPQTIDPDNGLLTCGSGCFPKVSKDHTEDCKRKSCKFTRKWLCNCPNATLEPVKEGLNNTVLKTHVINLWSKDPKNYDLMFSDSAEDDEEFMSLWYDYEQGRLSVEQIKPVLLDKIKYVSVKREWLDVYSFKDPILTQFDHRASLIKLKTTEIPRLKDSSGAVSPVVHGNYDVLKETGRTSGFASKLYPSANLQNIHRMARSCFKAREGHWILSTDYSGLEFISAGQRALDMVGESVYATIINKGWDAHAYLASQRAYRSEEWFRCECNAKDILSNDYEAIYHEFYKFKKKDRQIGFIEGKLDDKGQPVPKMFFKFYRNSAKPIGLGILGGMGAKMIAHVSGATYKIHMTPEEAQEYRNIFDEIFYPESQLLQMVNSDMIDREFSTRKKKRFRYITTMGMVRPNCSYASCANGSILQSTSAEGATLACIEIAKASYCTKSTSILKGNFKPWGFVHDEFLGDVVADPKIATLVAKEVERIMVESLQKVCPDLQPSAESALMIDWSKEAEKFVNKDGYLVPYEVKKNEALAKELNYI